MVSGMPREPETYRLNIERMDKLFPDAEILNIGQAAAAIGVERHQLKKLVPFEGHYISKANLAYGISKIGAVAAQKGERA